MDGNCKRGAEKRRRLRIGLLAFVSFTALLVALPSVAAASTPEPLDSHYVCALGSVIGSGQWWTPVILLNSPYHGSATGSTQLTTSMQLQFVMGAYSTSSSVSSTVYASNGDAVGLFQLDDYSMYRVTYRAEPGPGQNCAIPYGTPTAVMTGTTNNWDNQYLEPQGKGTYQNDINNQITQVSNLPGYSGLSGVDFNNMYQSETGTYRVCAPPLSIGISQSQETKAYLGVAISYGSISAGASLSMSSSSQYAFTYNFLVDGNYDYYSLDSSYSNGAWAFDYTGNNC